MICQLVHETLPVLTHARSRLAGSNVGGKSIQLKFTYDLVCVFHEVQNKLYLVKIRSFAGINSAQKDAYYNRRVGI